MLNARGLNLSSKRISCLDLLHRKKIDIAFIQESHLLKDDVFRFSNKHYQVLASSSFRKKSRGVLIVGRCKLPLTILDSGNDAEGRVAYVKTMLGNYKITFISVYAPNSHDQNFFDSLTLTLLDLSGFSLIVGGDFNGV